MKHETGPLTKQQAKSLIFDIRFSDIDAKEIKREMTKDDKVKITFETPDANRLWIAEQEAIGKLEEIKVYTHWLSALVNGDYSSFDYYNDPDDEKACKECADYIGNRTITILDETKDEFAVPDFGDGKAGEIITLRLLEI